MDSLGSLLEDIVTSQKKLEEGDDESHTQTDGEPQNDAVFAMLQRQLTTLTTIRSDLGKRELLIETLRQRCAHLEKETEAIPELLKRSRDLEENQKEVSRLSVELETLTATAAFEQAERLRLAQELALETKRAREWQEQGKRDRDGAQQELASLRAQLAVEHEKAFATQGLCDSLQRDQQLNEAALVKEIRGRKALEAATTQLQTELSNRSSALEKITALQTKTQKQRDVLSAGVASLKLEASQWKGLYEDLEGSVRAFRSSAESSQQKLLMEMNSLKEAAESAGMAQHVAERARDATSQVIESLGYTIDSIVNASPRAQPSPSRSSPSGSSSSSSPHTHVQFNTEQNIANFRIDMRAAIRQLGRLDASALSPAIQHEFHKLVSFLNDVIADSLDVQEEVHELRTKLDTAGAAIESATELLAVLESSLRHERETVERRVKDGRRMVAYVRSMWRQLREHSEDNKNGGRQEVTETEVENEQASEDAFDDLLPPLHNIFSLVTRKAHIAETQAARHVQSQQHIDSLLRTSETSRAHWEQQQHHQQQQQEMHLQEKLLQVQSECAQAIEAVKCESAARDDAWQKKLDEEKAGVAGTYREELEDIKRRMQESFDQKIREIIIETAGREVGRDGDEQRVAIYKAVCSHLSTELVTAREEKQLWGGKKEGLYGEVMRRLWKHTLVDCELVAALGAACDVVDERVIFRLAAYGKRRRALRPSLRIVTIYLLAALRFRALLALCRAPSPRLARRLKAFDVLEGGTVDQVVDAMLAVHVSAVSKKPSLLQRINRHYNSAGETRSLTAAARVVERTVLGLQRQLDELQAERDFLADLTTSLQEHDVERESLVAIAQKKVAAYGQTVDLLARQSNERTNSVLRVALAHAKSPPHPQSPASAPVSNGSSGYLTSPMRNPNTADPGHPVVQTLLAATQLTSPAKRDSRNGVSIVKEDILQLYQEVGQEEEYQSVTKSYQRSGLKGLTLQYPLGRKTSKKGGKIKSRLDENLF